MNTRLISKIALAVVALGVLGFGGWILSLPEAPIVEAPPSVPQEEYDATLAALKPPKRERPLIAIVGANEGTETTDYLMPFGLLKRADVADVIALGMKPGPVLLYPVFKVEPQATVADFDAQHPDGADFVIVPAMKHPDDPAVLQWIKAQREKGATVIGVCAGALVVANAGLLDGHRATTHWYYLRRFARAAPEHSVRREPAGRGGQGSGDDHGHHRIDVDVAAFSSKPSRAVTKAAALAQELGVRRWGIRHRSAVYKFKRPFAVTAMNNKLAVLESRRGRVSSSSREPTK